MWALKACLFGDPLPEILKAAAADARWLLDSRIDMSGGRDKLEAALAVVGRPLWPDDEPDWYKREAARMREFIEKHSPPVPEQEATAPVTVRIPPRAFLRSMATIFWTAIRHPFRTTEVDLSTGRVVRQY
jgi:hypothetical protein